MTWSAGETRRQQHAIGTLNFTQLGEPQGIALLRISYVDATTYLGAPLDVTVLLGDGSTLIGPLDAPVLLVGEEPFTVTAVPRAMLATPVKLQLSASLVGALTDRLYATRTVVLAPAATVRLPQWVRGVAAIPNASFVYLDRAGVAISGTLTGAHDRPLTADAISSAPGGSVTLYY
jgi:hypothetical protein